MVSNQTAASPIKFGTSGWRAIIADRFTFANVRLATAAIAGHVRSRNKNPVLIVGHDPRFFSEEFTAAAAAVLRANGVRVLLCDHAAPTPAIACEILRRKTDGAINFTASHNPAEYHGLKFSGPDGGPALPEVTKDIEARVAQLAGKIPPAPGHGEQKSTDGVERISPREPYLSRLLQLVNFGALRAAKLNFVCDPLHGCGAGYLDRALIDQGTSVHAIRTERDVLFDGAGPDVSESNLKPLRDAVLAHGASAGLATDGDADRFGIIDADGSFMQPNHILALLYDFVVETRGWKLGTARSVATTHLLDAVAKHFGQPVYQTPVGFKYVGELIKQDKIALGGEESAGLSIRGHVPEKDGILACLLVAEMIAVRGASLAEQLRALFKKVGSEFWPVRVNLHLPADVQTLLLERLKKDFKEFLGKPVAKEDRTDGLKLIFEDGSWVLMRLSGTEPLVRVYTEAGSRDAASAMAAEVQKWVYA
ncbi:MAG TPA: phosphoglucomutase/phosphomannomutase family protein [Candidatus Acidoferrales bacterium]|nr:phosphoglucomutase/phosphomannomutase family protein [Candidatus Acidoferrales bacterium]